MQPPDGGNTCDMHGLPRSASSDGRHTHVYDSPSARHTIRECSNGLAPVFEIRAATHHISHFDAGDECALQGHGNVAERNDAVWCPLTPAEDRSGTDACRQFQVAGGSITSPQGMTCPYPG